MKTEIIEKDWKKRLLIWWCYTWILTEDEKEFSVRELVEQEAESLVDLIFILKAKKLCKISKFP